MSKNKREYVKEIIEKLDILYPNAKISLNFKNPFELLIATILSAQCTDKRVNMVTKGLFKKYKTPVDFKNVDINTLEKEIYSTGFYKNKAKNIKKLATIIVDQYGGNVPNDIDILVKLPGIGRKTANVVLMNAFSFNTGVVVDTHMIRLSGRLGLIGKHLIKSKNANKIELVLNKIVEKSSYLHFSDLIIAHGREICVAKKPKCDMCILKDICPKIGVKKI
ncbi:MAG: endonuclease III [Patescibacteria group bacterium]